MKVIYLDQNQWIRLAKGIKHPSEDDGIANIIEILTKAVRSKSICLPLSGTTIFETYKIADTARRKELATLQATLSQGIVFVGRHARLARELAHLIQEIRGWERERHHPQWFLSNVFFEAFAEHDDKRIPFLVSDRLLAAIKSEPAKFMYDYLTGAPDSERRVAVKNWSDGSRALAERMERRREQTLLDSVSMRRRVYSALLLSDELDVILDFAREAGAPWQALSDIGPSNARKIIREAPIYHVERELALRLEAQSRKLDENDIRDMSAFCAAVPYADCIFAEKQFVNLTRQAGLHEHYDTLVSSDLKEIRNLI